MTRRTRATLAALLVAAAAVVGELDASASSARSAGGRVPTIQDLHNAFNPGERGHGFSSAHHYFRVDKRIQIRITFVDPPRVVSWVKQATSANACESKAKWRTLAKGTTYLSGGYIYFYPGGRAAFLRVKRGRWQLGSHGRWVKIKMTAGQWDEDDPLTRC
jgi:hypothetical protein